MKTQQFLIALVLISGTVFGQKIEPVSPYLDQFQNVRDFYITDDEKEAYFTIQSPGQDLSQIVCVKNKKWKNPILLPFSDGFSYLEPFLSRDGLRLYFASDRPKSESGTVKSDFDIWFVERKSLKDQWSKPINMGNIVNSENNEFYPTLSDNNNLYFTMDAKSGLGKDDIYYSSWNGKTYSKPVLLSNSVNSEGYEFNAFISADEQMLIYTKYNAKDGLGSGDLYVSKKDIHGDWQPSQHMGKEINSKYMEYCPFYNSKTGTLYFTSRRSSLVPQIFNKTNDFQKYISSGENGLSKIYKVRIKL